MNKKNWKTIDFFARTQEALGELLPVWAALQSKGLFILPSHLSQTTDTQGSMSLLGVRENPVLVFNDADLLYTTRRSPNRPKILMKDGEIRITSSEGVEAILHYASGKEAAKALEEFLQGKNPTMRKVDKVNGESIGIVYMCFGEKCARELKKSVESLHEIGLDIPVTVVGDSEVEGTNFIPWEGESPFDAEQAKNFQFRAGRIKPHLYKLSPYQRTLYIDADTEYMADILPGFEMLDDYDMAVTEETLTLGQLYNKKLAGWEINLVERDATIEELGGDARRKFINSGVIFFRKSKATAKVFSEWSKQWQRYQQWDEQLALMRALNSCKVNVKSLSVDWNHPHREKAKIIFHNYGRGVARTNIT